MTPYNPDEQRLIFDDLINCRELGGMPGRDGSVFKNKIMLRSGSPSLASGKACQMLKDYGVNTVIDLRSKAELEHYGNPFQDDPECAFYNIPLFVGDPDAKEDPTMNFLRTHTMGDFYVMMLEELGSAICDVMRVFVNRTEGVTLFHCAHGKDRTGVIAALLYLLIGASKEDIVLNYKVSYDYARSLLNPLIEAREPEMRHTLRSDADNMVTMLAFMEKEYNLDSGLYLTKNGLSAEDLRALRERIIQ